MIVEDRRTWLISCARRLYEAVGLADHDRGTVRFGPSWLLRTPADGSQAAGPPPGDR
jgi:hypothetical protein